MSTAPSKFKSRNCHVSPPLPVNVIAPADHRAVWAKVLERRVFAEVLDPGCAEVDLLAHTDRRFAERALAQIVGAAGAQLEPVSSGSTDPPLSAS